MKIKYLIVGACLALSSAQGAVLTFDPSTTITFDNLEEDASLSTIGWTGSETSYFTGTTPASGNSSTMAVTVTNTTNRTTISPEQTAEFSSNLLYFSAWVRRVSGTSGARFQVASDATSGGIFAGFGLNSSSPYNFAFYGNTSTDPDVTTMGWIVGNTTALVNTWYELAMVIDLNPTTPSDSLGYLYYRAVNDAEFTLLPEFDGVQMSWFTSDKNASDFTHWRVVGARSGVQFDNLSAGVVIPEPHVGMLFGTGGLALILWRRTREASRLKSRVSPVSGS